MPPKVNPTSQVELEARLEELWIRTRRCPLPSPPDLRTFPDRIPEEQLEDLWVRVRGCPIPGPIPLEYPTVATEQEESILRIEAHLFRLNQINPTSYYQLDVARRLITMKTGSPRFSVPRESWPITQTSNNVIVVTNTDVDVTANNVEITTLR
jgi:hypothetical protein